MKCAGGMLRLCPAAAVVLGCCLQVSGHSGYDAVGLLEGKGRWKNISLRYNWPLTAMLKAERRLFSECN